MAKRNEANVHRVVEPLCSLWPPLRQRRVRTLLPPTRTSQLNVYEASGVDKAFGHKYELSAVNAPSRTEVEWSGEGGGRRRLKVIRESVPRIWRKLWLIREFEFLYRGENRGWGIIEFFLETQTQTVKMIFSLSFSVSARMTRSFIGTLHRRIENERKRRGREGCRISIPPFVQSV